MTFSLAARDQSTGAFGMVVTSSSPAVAARCAHARAGVGVAASQNVTNPALGHRLLELLEAGRSARTALETVLGEDPHIAFRQLAVVDRDGGTAAFSGEQTLGTYHAVEGDGVVAAGNLLATPGVPDALVAAYVDSEADTFAGRLLDALAAGERAGGEEGPVRSCGLLVVDAVAWPVTDLRVDWHDDPIAELRRIHEVWQPQEADYLTRAFDPETAPSYGVPGDR